MKRTVEREKNLPAFSIDVAELEVLWGRILALFDQSETTYATLKIRLPSEELEFSSVEELKAYPLLRGKITKFSFFCSQYPKPSISIRSSTFFNPLAVVSATSDSESWCAGAIETVNSFLQPHRLWYNWFISAPIGWILVFLANLPMIAGFFLPKGTVIDKTVYAGWLAATIAIAIPYFGKSRLLPASVLRLSAEEGFIRRHGIELSLLVAIISAALTVVGWFVGNK